MGGQRVLLGDGERRGPWLAFPVISRWGYGRGCVAGPLTDVRGLGVDLGLRR